MPRMGTYTQADADRDIAVHAALTTGIHGVGVLYVAGFGVAGQELSKVIWKDASQSAMTDTDRTETLAFTELDLTAYTSSDAKFAILNLRIRADTVGSGAYSYLQVRKAGTTPINTPRVVLDKAGTTQALYHYTPVIVALDSDQKIEYALSVGTDWQVDSRIDVLGYIE